MLAGVVEDELCVGGIALRHIAVPGAVEPELSGHFHPKLRLTVRGRKVAGFTNGEEFFIYLRDAFDCLYREGAQGRPRMLSIGLHCRLAGRPGRAEGVRRFLDHVRAHDGVWFATRLDIARHWKTTHPFKG